MSASPKGGSPECSPEANAEGESQSDARIAKVADAFAVKKPDGPSKAERSPVEWMTAAEVFAELPQTTSIVEGLDLAHGRPIVFASFGSGGKTLSAQSMTLSLASGRPVWGKFQVPHPIRVGHIDVDQGAYATRRRYQRLRVGLGLKEEELGDRFLVCSMPRLQLHENGAEDTLVRIIEGARLGFLWLDAYRRLMPGFDENDSRYSRGFEACTRASERTGVPIAVLAHAGKKDNGGPGTAMRGTSALFDSAGAIYKFSGGPDAPKNVEHARPSALHEGPLGDPFKLEIVGEAGAPLVVRQVASGSFEPTEVKSRAEKLRATVLAFVVAHPGSGARGVREGVGGRATAVDAALRELAATDEIVKKDGKYWPRKVSR